MQKTRREDLTFIVRIWWEARDIEHQPEIWRGRVEHLNSAAEKFFSNIQDLVDFIEARIQSGSLPPPQPPLRKGRLRFWIKRS